VGASLLRVSTTHFEQQSREGKHYGAMPVPGLHPSEFSAATMSQTSIGRTAIGLKRQGLLTANGGWYASHLGQFFNFKLGCFASELVMIH